MLRSVTRMTRTGTSCLYITLRNSSGIRHQTNDPRWAMYTRNYTVCIIIVTYIYRCMLLYCIYWYIVYIHVEHYIVVTPFLITYT